MTYCKLCIGIIGNTIVHKFLFCNHGLPKWPPEQPITRHFRVFRHLQNHVSQRTYNRPVIIHVMVLPHNYTIKADNMLNVWVGCTVPLPSSQFWCKKIKQEMKWNMHSKKFGRNRCINTSNAQLLLSMKSVLELKTIKIK